MVSHLAASTPSVVPICLRVECQYLLISYGPDYVDQFRRAAAYVDRILKGEKPADLPVQTPTKYPTVINLNTAKAQGLNPCRRRCSRVPTR